jgi:hypothetical protein
MSERKIKYQFSAIPIEWLINPKLSQTEKVVLGVLIWLGDESGVSRVGYEKLAGFASICKNQCMRVISSLEKMKLVERTIRNNRRFSNELRVCFENLGGDSQNNTQESHRSDSCVENQESHFQNSGVTFDENGSHIGVTLNKNLNLNLKFKNGGSNIEVTPDLKTSGSVEEIAPANVVAGKMKPSGEQVAARDLAKDEYAEAQAAKIQALLPVLSEYFGDSMPWIQIFEVSNKIGIRVLGGRISGIDLDVVRDFAARHGIIFSQQQFQNERIVRYE